MAPSALSFEIPDPICESRLMHSGGFALYAESGESSTFGEMRQEAAHRLSSATAQECWDADVEEHRGGTPARKLLTTEAGPVQDELYRSEWLVQFLSAACGLPVAASGNRGSYSYYARPGDFLGLHRDVEMCDLAMITTLYDNSDPSEQSGALVLYPERVHEPLSKIRERPSDGAQVVKMIAGQTLIMFGGIVPHQVLPVRKGQLRVISVLCFRALRSKR